MIIANTSRLSVRDSFSRCNRVNMVLYVEIWLPIIYIRCLRNLNLPRWPVWQRVGVQEQKTCK